MLDKKAFAAAALAVLCAAPVRADAANAFMGHYGYMLTFPNSYTAAPGFNGEIETTDVIPKKCAGLKKRSECVKLGLVEVYALPKRVVTAEVKAKDFAAYLKMIQDEAAQAGLKTRIVRQKRAGFPAALIEMPGHPQPLNTMLLVEGTKVYYRFKYNDKAGSKIALALADSLKEVAPHDNPPGAE